jgi:hypothetical protein
VSEADRYQKSGLDFEAVDRMSVNVFLPAYEPAPRQIVLDLDRPDDPLHGGQEGRCFHGYYGHYCYLPWYLCGGEPRWGARLRVSNIDGAAGSQEELPRLVRQSREAWPEVPIIVRGDAGFCREELMAWGEANQVDYVLGLAKNERLKAEITAELHQAAEECQRTGQAARVFKEFVYQTRESWARARRVVGKAEQGSAELFSNSAALRVWHS